MRGNIHHIDLTVRDAHASREFYEAVLSFMGYELGDSHPRGYDFDLVGPPFCSIGILSASGANAGRTAEVASHQLVSGVRHIALLEAPVRPIEAGDGFVVRAGCDKRLETCRDRFANVVNFRGFPHIPGQDTVIRYPNRGDANAGEVL